MQISKKGITIPKTPKMRGLQSRGKTGNSVRITKKQADSEHYFNTLAQLPTTEIEPNKEGKRGDLLKRARAKWHTQQVVSALLTIDSPLSDYYRRAQECNDHIIQEGKNIRTSFCNTRVCHECNRLRTAKLMNGYMKPLMELMENGGLEFVTLTIVNVTQDKLCESANKMKKELTNIIRVLNEKRGRNCSGIRKLECTYNEERNDYHPHLHVLVDKEVGNEIVEEWLIRNPTSSIKGQLVKKADQESLNELFKYTTKMDDVKSNKSELGKREITINAKALDTIFQAFYGMRTIQNFGKITKVSEIIEGNQSVDYTDIKEYPKMLWDWNEYDWNNYKCLNDWKALYPNHKPSALTKYKPPDIKFNIIHENQENNNDFP